MKKIKKIFNSLLVFSVMLMLQFCAKIPSENNENAVQGKIFISSQEFEKRKTIALNGEWELYSGRFISSEEFSSAVITPDAYIKIPGAWKTLRVNGKPAGDTGAYTLRLTAQIPENYSNELYIITSDIYTSYRLYVNGRLIQKCGTPGLTKESARAQLGYQLSSFSSKDEKVEFIIHISNFVHRNGGVWDSIKIGSAKKIKTEYIFLFVYDFFVCGILLAICIYHFSIFCIYRKEYASIYFAAFCFLFSIRSGLVNSRAVHLMTGPDIWPSLNRLEVLTFFLAVPVFTLFMFKLYEIYFNRRIIKAIVCAGIISSIAIFFIPVLFVSKFVIVYEYFTVIVIFYCIYSIIRAVIKKEHTAKMFLISLIILFISSITDMISINLMVNMRQISPVGIVVMSYLQSLIITRKYFDSYQKVESLKEDLILTNSAYSRFIPREILKLLNKSSIINVKLGDFSEKQMTVMFSDIRRFTSLSEQMTPEETFKFLNSYLSRMGPIIRKHGGIIDKYIGDAIMALFPVNTSSAINAAIEIRRELLDYNEQRHNFGYPPLDIGIGIHTGSIIVGTIGENERMDGTVISDSVNLASRLEDLTKIGAPVIISNITLFELENQTLNQFRFLGQVYVKGKMKHISVYEIYDFEEAEQIELKNRTKTDFERGLLCLYKQEFREAEQLFQKVCSENSKDKPAFFYLERARNKMPIPFLFNEAMLKKEIDGAEDF